MYELHPFLKMSSYWESHLLLYLCLHVIDIAAVSIEQCQQRYNDIRRRGHPNDRTYSAEFITADCSRVRASVFSAVQKISPFHLLEGLCSLSKRRNLKVIIQFPMVQGHILSVFLRSCCRRSCETLRCSSTCAAVSLCIIIPLRASSRLTPC